MHTDLHQNPIGHPAAIKHLEVGRRRCLGRRIAALLDKRILGRQSDDMGVCVDRARGNTESGRTLHRPRGTGAGGRRGHPVIFL